MVNLLAEPFILLTGLEILPLLVLLLFVVIIVLPRR